MLMKASMIELMVYNKQASHKRVFTPYLFNFISETLVYLRCAFYIITPRWDGTGSWYLFSLKAGNLAYYIVYAMVSGELTRRGTRGCTSSVKYIHQRVTCALGTCEVIEFRFSSSRQNSENISFHQLSSFCKSFPIAFINWWNVCRKFEALCLIKISKGLVVLNNPSQTQDNNVLYWFVRGCNWGGESGTILCWDSSGHDS